MHKFFIAFLFLTSAHFLYPECPTHYSEMTMQDHIKLFPINEHEWWTKEQTVNDGRVTLAISPVDALPDGAGVSALIKFSGKFRVITPDAFIALGSFGGPKMKALYSHELRISEQGFDGWVAVQYNLVDKIKKQIKKGENFYVCMVLIGVINDRHFYLMNNFSTENDESETKQ
ncbi:MAG: hypothetical protein ABUK01_01815 [Leptospirales bacterium]